MAPGSKSLTVGMATHDDFDGAYFTIQSIRLHHQEVLDRLDFLLVDNNPGGPQSAALERLRDAVPGLRYVANREIQGTAVRDLVFRLATTPSVLCLDSHVLMAPGALGRLLDYLDARPDARDLLQGPLLGDDLGSISTHFDPVWRAGMYGTWAIDERGRDPDGEPFEIPMQGLGLFACRRDAWPGLNPRFSGFGGEEGYLHEKFRRRGGECLCLPFLRWLHRFQRPGGPSYEVSWSDRIRNYLLGLDELGASDEEAVAHFRELLGRASTDAIAAEVRREIASPFHQLDAIYCASPDEHWERMARRLSPLGIDRRLRRVSPVQLASPIGRALAHRIVLEEAKRQELETVLVIDDGADFLDGAEKVLRRVVDGWRGREWDAIRLGNHGPGPSVASPEPSVVLARPDRPASRTPATVYRSRAIDRLLAALPRSADAMDGWLKAHGGLDAYLARELEVLECVSPVVTWRPFASETEGSGHRPTGSLRLRPDADIAILEDSVLVYGQGTGPAASLNPTAGLVVRLIDGERSADEIVEILQALYPEAADILPSEVGKVLDFLRASGLLG